MAEPGGRPLPVRSQGRWSAIDMTVHFSLCTRTATGDEPVYEGTPWLKEKKVARGGIESTAATPSQPTRLDVCRTDKRVVDQFKKNRSGDEL